MREENIGLFSAVSDSLASGNVSEAETINEIIVDTNLIETYKKTVNDMIIYRSQHGALTTGDSVTLNDIAHDDPVHGGKAVYKARAILHLLIADHTNSSPVRIKPKESIADESFAIFPNPSTGLIYIKSSKAENVMTEVKVFDIAGRELKKFEAMNVSNFKLDISDLVSGSYNIQIKDSTDKIFIKLIVLTK